MTNVATLPATGPKLYVYRIAPIDFWGCWHEAKDVVNIDFGAEPYPNLEFIDAGIWNERWFKAKHAARTIGWDGDIRNGPYVCGIPENDEGGFDFIIGWKQDNNGTTFIASPHPMAWLEDKYWPRAESMTVVSR